MKYLFSLLVIITTLSCSSKNKPRGDTASAIIQDTSITKPITETLQKEAWKFKHVSGGTIIFEGGKSLQTNLFDLAYIGQLEATNKAPFMILAGRSCTDCDENLSLYIHSPSDGSLTSNGTHPRYSYPGTERDYLDNSILIEARMFYGNCLKDRGSCAAWVQKERDDAGKFVSSIFLIEVSHDTLKENRLPLDSTILMTLTTNCKELPGIEITSEP
jgi:hypothetical protein